MNEINLYEKIFNLHDATWSLIEHDNAIVATVYKIIDKSGCQYILKISDNDRHYFREVYLLKKLTDLPVPRMVDFVDPSQENKGAVLMECLQGELLNEKNITIDIVNEIGAVLAKVHNHRLTGYGYGDVIHPERIFTTPQEAFTKKFNEGLSECRRAFSNELIEKYHSFYENHVHLLNIVDGPCITHWDFRPGNIMVNNGKLQGVIDWASSRGSFAEMDFCPLELGEWNMSDACTNAFLKGYASIRPIPDYKRVMPLLSFSRVIATLGYTIKTNTSHSKNVALYRSNVKLLDEILKGGKFL